MGIGATHGTLIARVVDGSGPTARGPSVATFTACWELGVGAGAMVVGPLADVAGIPTMFMAVALLSILSR